MTDLDFVAPAELPFTDGALAITVRPADMGQITAMLRQAKPLVDALVTLPPEMVERLVGREPGLDDLAHLLDLVCDHGDMATTLVAIATRQPQAVVQALLPDRFAYLLSLVVEANLDFFARSADRFTAAGQRLQRAMDAARRAGAAPAGSAPSTS